MGDGVKMHPTGFGLGYAVMSPSGDLVYVNESSAGLLTYRDAQGRLSSVLPVERILLAAGGTRPIVRK